MIRSLETHNDEALKGVDQLGICAAREGGLECNWSHTLHLLLGVLRKFGRMYAKRRETPQTYIGIVAYDRPPVRNYAVKVEKGDCSIFIQTHYVPF